METIQYNAALVITFAIEVPLGKNYTKNLEDSSTATLVKKTLLFLQNTKITASEVTFLQLFPYTICHTKQCNKIVAINAKHGFFKNIFFL